MTLPNPPSPAPSAPKIPLHLRLLAPFLRLFFQLLYHQFAWTYDLVAATVSLGMWQDWVRAILPYLSEPRLLELGFGPGHLQEALYKQGWRPIGLDRSPQMTRQARRRLRKQHFTPALVNGAAQSLPFPDNSFDHVVATFPSEYIADPRTLAEIQRVLAPGGRADILLFAWITGKKPLERLAAWLFRFTGESPDWSDKTLLPVQQAGFQAHIERIVLPSSTLLLIRGQKTAPGAPD